jgi:hypothetical protein
LNWDQLREVHSRVAAGRFGEVAKTHPFPSQLFSYGFEHAVAREHAAGRRVDLQPMQDSSATIFRFVDLNKIQDPSVVTSDIVNKDENALRATTSSKAESGRDLVARVAGRTVRGLDGDWNFIRHYGRSGDVHERAWRQGLMRLWSRQGTAVEANGALCVDFPSYPRQCIARAYDLNGVTYTFSETGAPISTFKWLPANIPLPPDLTD